MNVEDIKADAATRIGRRLVRTTPVDTAKARSNWVASAGSPDLSERPVRSASETIDEIAATARRVDAETDIVIANGGDKVPYLDRLENGSSTQAPAGFVAASVEAGVPAVQRGRVLKRRRDV